MLETRWDVSTTPTHSAEPAARFSLPKVRQNRQLRECWAAPHQRSGHYPRAWKVRNRPAGVNKEDRKGMGQIQDSERTGSIRQPFLGTCTNRRKRGEPSWLYAFRSPLRKRKNGRLPKMAGTWTLAKTAGTRFGRAIFVSATFPSNRLTSH